MSEHRFCCCVVHRRGGKTVLAVNTLIAAAMALPQGRFAYIAPTVKQAKSISWPIFREYTLGIPGIDFRPAENKIVFPNGAEVMLFSADLHDSIRGHGLDGAVLDEVASFPAEAWPTSIRPTLSDKNGWALFVGTVRGQGDEFHRAYPRRAVDEHLPLYLQPDHHKEEDWDFTPGVFHDHREYGY
ncbi:terminase large subunit domain-containing protein [Roseobacter weihaiensis]|uniref:terminase large subunit domain-containing protein n=1 Tax=Roseobacter weihaiensis TaxID=2763262 RepID=UPI001D0A946E|nr:terminase family protein [Roseobacter sp. H9]